MSIIRVLKGDSVLSVAPLNHTLPEKVPRFGAWVWHPLPGVTESFFTYTCTHQMSILWLCPIISALCSQLYLYLYMTVAKEESQLI